MGLRRKHFRFLLLTVLTASLAYSQSMASVTSSDPFTLRGASVNPELGVPAFPIIANDTIRAGSAPTVVTFPDGSTFALDPGSEARVEILNGRPLFRLLKGRAVYVLSSLAAVGAAEAGRIVTPTKLEGILSLGTTRTGGFWVPGNTALLLGGAGAVAILGVGITKLTSGPSSVSPSQP